ncbi:hypothetical protein KIH74_11190 [Kineosporia sp. J2-2]|uniref:Calcium-binding protein n=1 Tax=Kineosporia corallincola TaxID=2835133 RepID=A0ABS5TEG9_9ACTN|nr:calcium-binding protein [Kineosporia corallincola]MBT0769488.1 hypothetical protein [Kineosporia corallincola]
MLGSNLCNTYVPGGTTMALRRKRLSTLLGTASLVTVGVVPLMLAAPAQAAVPTARAVVMDWEEDGFEFIFYDDDATQAHQINLKLERAADRAVLVYTLDDVVDIEAGAGCAHPDSGDLTKVACEFPDTLNDGNIRNDSAGNIYLGSGDDTFTFDNSANHPYTGVYLDEGDNTYVSGSPGYHDASITSGAGRDTITAGALAYVDSGDGDDVITLAGAGATVRAGAGQDQINGTPGRDTIDGGAGDDTIVGGAGIDTLSGGAGNDTIQGDDGDDEINGGDGDDVLYGGAGIDTIHGGLGNDVVYGDDGDDFIYGDQGNDELYGGRDDDTMYGNSGDDTIFGNSGDDYISGGPGTDTISGGTGTNTIVD